MAKQGRGNSEMSEVPLETPLVVDMDGTLLKVDVLAELAARLLLKNPLKMLKILIMSKNRLETKNQLAKSYDSAGESFPSNPEVLQIIKEAKSSGRRVYLATASSPVIADSIARQIGLFDGVYASSESDLKGREKALLLDSMFGAEGYDYIGDSKVDYPVWKGAREAFIVGSPRQLSAAERSTGRKISLIKAAWSFGIVIRQLRVEHWIKNSLLFLPLILAGSFSVQAIFILLWAFLGISFVASALYILNDVNDLVSDRLHPRKRMRPIASGELQVAHALGISALLISLGLLISFFGAGVLGLLLVAAYGLLSFLYTLVFKRLPLVDLFILSLLYTFRIFIGATVSETYLSFWLVLFSFLTFAFLASLKRVAELQRVSVLPRKDAVRNSESSRGYLPSDAFLVKSLGASLTVGSLTVLGIYSESTFDSNDLGILSFILIFGWAIWCANLWLDVERGRLRHDPVRHALRDKKSILTLLLMLVAYIGFSYGGWIE